MRADRKNRTRTLFVIFLAVASLMVSGIVSAAEIRSGTPSEANQGRAAAKGKKNKEELFRHVGTFDVMDGNGSSVAEIVDATKNGNQLVYTDGPNEEIGFVDISDPSHPSAGGVVGVGGQPTSLVVLDPLILVGVNTSPDFENPSGQLVVVHRNNRRIVATHELGGQPDSLALAPDRKRAAIVIENERDEDVNNGLIPQPPSGKLLIVDLHGNPARWDIVEADLSSVAAAASDGEDLEPEFVDINKQNEAVVSLQENNHLAIVDLESATTEEEFPAESVDLEDVDTEENDLIEFDSDIIKRREPDAVAWIDNDTFATANEGDYTDASGEEGGSRGFTLFNEDGTVEFESNASFEHLIGRMGQYNEGRSENKGVEPEAVEVGNFHKLDLLFVGSERSNAVGVYELKGSPVPRQVLPTGIGPEGIRAIPKKDLFVASTETDVADIGIPTMINIYRMEDGPAAYPMIQSAEDADGLPIPWVALSGLVGDPSNPDIIYAVSDAFLAEGFIYTVDVSATPATIVDRMAVTGASDDLDLEGIAVGPDGHLWLGSEGAEPGGIENLVLKVDPTTGAVVSEIALPAGLVDTRRSNGIEGVAVTGSPGAEVVYVAIQRAWPAEGDTDKVNTKIGRYDVVADSWGFVHYSLEPEGGGDWIGLSELTLLPDGTFAVIERDKGWGPTTGFNAELKALYGVDLAAAEFRAFDDSAGLVTIDKTLLRDVLPDLAANSIWTPEKLEGVAVGADGNVYAVTDNDGLDDATGETVFLRLGDWSTALDG